MTDSFFLVQLIDKSGYYGIRKLLNRNQDAFRLGESIISNSPAFIRGIEPQPERSIDANKFRLNRDLSSIWLGLDVSPQETFEENIILFRELERWVTESLYIFRFLINLNLKAKLFFHIEIEQEGADLKKISIQKNFDPGFIHGSSFHVDYNRYEKVLPLIIKLLNYGPTNKFKAILYNYANAYEGVSGIIEYFYIFTALEGIVHNWADEKGYSELWGAAIATPEEQNSIHTLLKNHFEQFLRENRVESINDPKNRQLKSFCASTFPNNRKIMRSLWQRLRSYLDLRIPQDIESDETIQTLRTNFHRIYSRRNQIGHSLETYLRESRFTEDIKTLYTSIKLLMDFELIQFIEGESDWKFEERSINLTDFTSQLAPKEVLKHFHINLNGENQSDNLLSGRKGTQSLQTLEFQSNFEYNTEENGGKISYNRKAKVYYPPDQYPLHSIPEANSQMVDVYSDPYFWLYTTIENTNYIIKTFENGSFTSSGREYCTEFTTDDIIMFIKVESFDIPETSILFTELGF